MSESNSLDSLYKQGTVKRKVAELVLKIPYLKNGAVASQCSTTKNVVYTVKGELRKNKLLTPKQMPHQEGIGLQPIPRETGQKLPEPINPLPSQPQIVGIPDEHHIKVGRDTYDVLSRIAAAKGCTLDGALREMLAKPTISSEESKAIELKGYQRGVEETEAKYGSYVRVSKDTLIWYQFWKETVNYDGSLQDFVESCVKQNMKGMGYEVVMRGSGYWDRDTEVITIDDKKRGKRLKIKVDPAVLEHLGATGT